jgi:hypothetical protein
MEREGQESSGEPPQAAEEEQSHISEKRRVIMAVTQMLDLGTLDEKSLRLLEQLADCVQCSQAEVTREVGPIKQAAAQQATPARGEPVEVESSEATMGEPSSSGDSGHITEKKVVVGSLPMHRERRPMGMQGAIMHRRVPPPQGLQAFPQDGPGGQVQAGGQPRPLPRLPDPRPWPSRPILPLRGRAG